SVGYNFDGVQNPVVHRKGDDPTATTGNAALDYQVLSVPNFYGAHGYDPNLLDMSAILFAAGPDVSHGSGSGLISLVHNIHVAARIDKLLGVQPASTVQGSPINLKLP